MLNKKQIKITTWLAETLILHILKNKTTFSHAKKELIHETLIVEKDIKSDHYANNYVF